MKETPEPLAAILAEMRAYADRLDDAEMRASSLSTVRAWADRIEAAYKRERAITDVMLAVKDKPLPHPDPDNAPPMFAAPGNAAALREALENARPKFIHIKKCADEGEVSRKKLTILCEFASQEIAAALAAPARNCDRFRTLDDFSMADSPIDTPLTNATREQLYKVIRWLFAPAEGGSHA